jgi:hypothetical protein
MERTFSTRKDRVRTDEEVRSREEGRGVPVGFIKGVGRDNLSPMMVDG